MVTSAETRATVKEQSKMQLFGWLTVVTGTLGCLWLAEIYKDDIRAYQYVVNEGVHHPIVPVVASVMYLLVVDMLPRIMKDRAPMKLAKLKIVHNYFLCVFSFVIVYKVMEQLLPRFVLVENAIEKATCDSAKVHQSTTSLYFWYNLFYLSKIYELLDTVFLCLDKKKLIFLHVYHHLITMWLVWTAMNLDLSMQWMNTSINATVHVFMYFYYMMQTMNVPIWWKKYLTTLQIVQFIVDEVGNLVWLYFSVHHGEPCAGGWLAFSISVVSMAIFLALFIQFYYTTYRQKPRRTSDAVKKRE